MIWSKGNLSCCEMQGAHYRETSGKTGYFVKKIREFGKNGENQGILQKHVREISGNFQLYIYTDSFPIFQDIYICQSRDCNLVESQILLVETPIGVSTSRVPDWGFYR